MNRRSFISRTSAGVLAGMLLPDQVLAGIALPDVSGEFPKFRVRTLTHGPKHHFFGYYGMSPWNRDETRMVCLESDFHDRLPHPDEKASIGLVDPESGAFTPISETLAWNLQQGSLLHWNPIHPNTEIIYNDRNGDELQAAILNVETGKKHHLARAISAVHVTNKHALRLTYGRLTRLRKVVGYAASVDPYADQAHPTLDGVFSLNLKTGKSKLILSIAEVFEQSVGGYPQLANRHMWFNHTVINPSGTRFLFLARTSNEKRKLDSAMFTVNMDGTDLRMVIPFGTGVSHFGWRNDKEIIATFKLPGEKMLRHILFHDGEVDYRIIGENFLIDNGHCTYSPDGNWMATDRKQDESNSQSLWLYDMSLDQGMLLCNKPVNERKFLHTNTRCDFHPRWNHSGNTICFDAIDTGSWTRQMHVVEFLP